jgi:hypothetical protein
MPFLRSLTLSWGLELCLLLLLWGLSIAVAYRDLERHRRPRGETLAWLALVALLPGLGLAAYLLSRLFDRSFPLPATDALGRAGRRRVTQLRPEPAGPERSGTVAAAALIEPTLADRRQIETAGIALLAVAGPHTGQEFSLETLPARLGRGGDVDLRLDRDLGVSRQHAEIYRADGALHLRDLSSTHGTAVNGVAVSDRVLQAGDRIEVGYSTLLVTAPRP